MPFTKTVEKTKETAAEARHTARDAADTVHTGIDESRKTAAGALATASKRVRGGSKRASRAMHRTGVNVADRLDSAATTVKPTRRRGPVAYARRHPLGLALFFGLVAGIVVVLWFRRTAANWDDDAETEFYSGYPS